MNCDYCDSVAKLVIGKEIYPHRRDLHNKRFWQCKPCNAYVGCHPNTDKPLGRLANAELRQVKINAHSVFDTIWKSGEMSRTKAYKWLADKLNIKDSECHIGMFDIEKCKDVVFYSNQFMTDMNDIDRYFGVYS